MMEPVFDVVYWHIFDMCRKISQRRHYSWQNYQKAYRIFRTPWNGFYLQCLMQQCQGEFPCVRLWHAYRYFIYYLVVAVDLNASVCWCFILLDAFIYISSFGWDCICSQSTNRRRGRNIAVKRTIFLLLQQVCNLIHNFQEYLDVLVSVARKTDSRHWPELFAVAGNSTRFVSA